MPEMLRVMGIAKGAELMALNINKFPPEIQIELFTLLSENLAQIFTKF